MVNITSDCTGMSPDEVVKQILSDRKISDVDHFLHPTRDDLLPLDALKNATEAAEIVSHGVEYGLKFALLADTDLDGITSGAIMYRYLQKMGANVDVFIDHGEQHGLQEEDVDQYKEFDILIIVDSLDHNCYLYEEVQTDSNIQDIIVLDHHAINPGIPYNRYITLVSSQNDYPNKELSGAGVTWKFCMLLDEINGTDYAEDLVDLAGSGLVADMVSVMEPENRYIISKALEGIKNPAIKKIVGGFEWNSTAISFSVAPLVNATNRLDKNKYALSAFITDDNKDVLNNVKAMKKCKEDQNAEIDSMLEDVYKQCDDQLDKKMIIIDIDTEYGIAGLIGNKLLEKYQRPLLIVREINDTYTGSMRAVGVDDFRTMLNESGLANSFGHELAASVSFLKEDREKLVQYMEEHLPDVGTVTPMQADIKLDIHDIDRTLIDQIKQLDKISGTGFKQIRVYFDGITDYEVSQMSDYKHLVIKPTNSYLTFVKWNWNGDWDEMEDNALLGEELEAVATLDSGWLGRNFMLKAVCDYIGVKK